jgi:endonuclease/exonuclease/phosphatase family metal-dependent hydrolase
MSSFRSITFIFFIAISANCPAQGASPTPSPQPLRVAFWNIQWFPGRHPFASASSERTQTVSVHRDIRKINADLIGMEEVRDFFKAELAISPLPEMKVDVVSNFPPREDQDVGQQVAIASRFQPLSAWVEMWKPNGALVPPRGFAFAAYEIAPRHLLLVYAVHLKSNRGEVAEDIAIREESMRQLTAHMHAMNDAYGKLGTISWIVGGDFNTAPDDSRFAAEKTTRLLRDNGFSWCWQDIPFARRISLPADKLFPAACFDHIFVRNGKCNSARVIEMSRGSSDHNAIFAEVQL